MVADASPTALRLTADAVLILLIAVNAYGGWRTGLVRRALTFGGLYAALYAATSAGNALGATIHRNDIYANAWGFVAIAAAVVILFEVLGYLYHDQIQKVVVVMFDRVAGAIAGGIIGFFEAAILFLVITGVGQAPANAGTNVPPGHAQLLQAVDSSILASKMQSAEPGVQAVFSPVLAHDMAQHLVENSQPTPATS